MRVWAQNTTVSPDDDNNNNNISGVDSCRKAITHRLPPPRRPRDGEAPPYASWHCTACQRPPAALCTQHNNAEFKNNSPVQGPKPFCGRYTGMQAEHWVKGRGKSMQSSNATQLQSFLILVFYGNKQYLCQYNEMMQGCE